MARRRDFLRLSLVTLFVAGCAKEPEATKALRALGVTYRLPKGWTHEDAEDKGAVFILSPEVGGGVAATAMIEMPKEQNPRQIARLLRDQSEDLSQRHPDYKEVRLDPHVKLGPNFLGVLEYTATKKQVPLSEQYMLMQFGKDRTLLVFTSIATDVKSEYLPTLQEFLNSIRVAAP